MTAASVDILPSSPNRDLLPDTAPAVVDGLLVDPIIVITNDDLVEEELIPPTIS